MHKLYFALLMNLFKKNIISSLFLTLVMASGLIGESLVFPPYTHSYGIRKATPKHLFMFFGTSSKFTDPQGLATTRLDSWDDPETKKDDDEVVVYGVNSGMHQIIYNTSMYALALYGKKGSGNGCFMFPKGIVTNNKGDVYIADSGNNRIVHLFNPKAGLIWKTSFNGASQVDSGMTGPMRVSLDEDGNLYAADAVHRKIFVFTKDHSLKMTIPAKGSSAIFADSPTALVVADGTNHWSFFKNERVIFCADQSGTRLWKIQIDGTVIKNVKLPDGYHAFYGATDYYHNFWITDIRKHCVIKYDHELNFLEIFGSHGEKKDQFVEPRGIAIYKRFGQVFIAEKSGAQYYWIGTQYKGASLKMASPSKFDLTVKSTEFSFVSLLSVSDNKKDTVYYLKKQMFFPLSDQVRISDSSGLGKASSIELKIEPTYSSYTFNSWFYPLTILK